MSALIQGIPNHKLIQELSLRPSRSMCEPNEVISHHIFVEETEKWRAEQDRLLIDDKSPDYQVDNKKGCRPPPDNFSTYAPFNIS
ncbi:hypothetical protein ACLOJK_014044 [Asimina triloba]